MQRRGIALLCLALPVLVVAAGCGPQTTVTLRYSRPAQYQIPENIVSLGIAEFAGQTDEDKRWGNIAADQLASELDKYNKQFNRYRLVDRKRLKAILDEQDLQAAFSDSSKAIEAGKIANVDAMIYGTASVSVRDDQVSKTSIDPLRQSLREVSYTERHVMAAVNFTIDDVKSGSTLTTVSAMREFDSSEQGDDSAGKAIMGAIGFSSGDLPAADQVTADLINQCVCEFLRKISPHEVVTTEKLGSGKSSTVKTGNKLAKAGSHQEALEMYLAALAVKPDDHGAAFNAGVMYEKLGQLDKAADHYDQAFRIKPEEQYVMARQRARSEKAACASPAAVGQAKTGQDQ